MRISQLGARLFQTRTTGGPLLNTQSNLGKAQRSAIGEDMEGKMGVKSKVGNGMGGKTSAWANKKAHNSQTSEANLASCMCAAPAWRSIFLQTSRSVPWLCCHDTCATCKAHAPVSKRAINKAAKLLDRSWCVFDTMLQPQRYDVCFKKLPYAQNKKTRASLPGPHHLNKGLKRLKESM